MNASARRASKVLDKTRTLTNKALPRLGRAVVNLETVEPALQQCVRSWGAYVLMARQLESTVRSGVHVSEGREEEPLSAVVAPEGTGGSGTSSPREEILDEQVEYFLNIR